MAATEEKSHADLEEGGRNRSSDACSDGSLDFSESDAHHRSCWLPSHPPLEEFNGNGDGGGGGSKAHYDRFSSMSAPQAEIRRDVDDSHRRRNSSSSTTTTTTTTTTSGGSDCWVEVVEVNVELDLDLECGVGVPLPLPVPEVNKKPHLVVAKMEKNCRICHLSFEDLKEEEESGVVNNDDEESSLSGSGSGAGTGGVLPIIIELGCSCKDDLAAAHKHCAEAWFKIKGNKICEICGATARNLVGANETEVLMEQWNEISNAAAETTTAEIAAVPPAGTQNFWHGHRLLNLVLACMVFAFVISWLFHFNMPS